MSNPGILTVEQRQRLLLDVDIPDDLADKAWAVLKAHDALDLVPMIFGGAR